jgi:hypothetical protein
VNPFQLGGIVGQRIQFCYVEEELFFRFDVGNASALEELRKTSK